MIKKIKINFIDKIISKYEEERTFREKTIEEYKKLNITWEGAFEVDIITHQVLLDDINRNIESLKNVKEDIVNGLI